MAGERGPRRCAWALRQLDCFLDGTIEPSALDAFVAHARDCASCAATLAAAQRAREALGNLPRLTDDQLPARINAAVVRVAENDTRTVQRSLARLPRAKPSPGHREAIRASVAAQASARAGMCRTFGDRVEALLDGDLPAGLTLALERHALGCSVCAHTLATAKTGRAALAGAPRLAPAVASRQRIRDAIERIAAGRRRTRRQVAWVGAAVAACLAVVAGLYGSGQWVQPPELIPHSVVADVPASVAESQPVAVAPAEPAPATPPQVEMRVAARPASPPEPSRRAPGPTPREPLWTSRPADDAPAVAANLEGPVDTYVAPPRETIRVASSLPPAADAVGESAAFSGHAEPTSIASAHNVTLAL